jgi:ribosomal protein S12 methylthiotransferase
MASRADVCNYVDIPLQHISDRILKSMRRGVDKAGTYSLMAKFREKLPLAVVRAAFIVGYPGETEAEFEELKTFIRDTRFDRVGVFTYSHEEDTFAFGLEDDVPAEVKQSRAAEIMEIQQGISLGLNKIKVGKLFKVLIDRLEGDFFVGRTEFDSPEVDNEVLIKKSAKLKIGEFYTVKIVEADAFDLFGKIEKKSSK